MQTALVDAQWPRSSYDTSRDLLFQNSQDLVTKSGSVERLSIDLVNLDKGTTKCEQIELTYDGR